MANRRMFSLKIVDSDAFLDMPQSTQLLYFHLSMRADDDGFVGNPKKVMRMIGSSEDDYKVLIAKRFILNFESGVVVIKHWKIHNYIQTDRYQPTQYLEEKKTLETKENGAYTDRIQDVSKMDTQVRDRLELEIVKDSKEKETSPSTKKFVQPTIEEVKAYCEERKNKINPQNFIDFYSSKGWKVGNQPMKDWQACIRTWEGRDRDNGTKSKTPVYKNPRTENTEVKTKKIQL